MKKIPLNANLVVILMDSFPKTEDNSRIDPKNQEENWTTVWRKVNPFPKLSVKEMSSSSILMVNYKNIVFSKNRFKALTQENQRSSDNGRNVMMLGMSTTSSYCELLSEVASHSFMEVSSA